MKRILATVCCAPAAFFVTRAPCAHAQVVTDNFSDLNDTSNPAWVHLDGLVNSTGQTWNASTGQYRMTAPNNGFSNLGFVGSYVGQSYADVTVSADIVSFIDDPVAQGAVFGVAARLSGENAFNSLTGYGYAYEPHAAGGQGEMVLYRIGGATVTDLGAQQVTLDPARDYRFVLDVQGTQLHGQVFEIGGGLVAERFVTDTNYASGFPGLFAYSQDPLPGVDVTWDNFSAVPEPAAGLLFAAGAGALLRRRRAR
jgi:hypothetical protein